MAKKQMPRGLNGFNSVIRALLRLGIKIGNMNLVTIRGRKSGKLITSPLWVSRKDGQTWLVSPYGNVNWVRNLRAAGEATLSRGRWTERVSAYEPIPREAAPLLKQSLAESPSFLHVYYDVKPDAPLEDFEREIQNHPIFVLKKLA